MSPGRLLLIDDHTLFRTGLRLILSQSNAVREIHEAGSIAEAVERYAGSGIDLILLDQQLPGINGFDGTTLLRRYLPEARILMVSGNVEALSDEERASRGVLGWLPKSADPSEVEQAVLHYLAGGEGLASSAPPPPAAVSGELTARQLQVLQHLCRGLSNKAIAYELGLAENTVRVHVSAILDQLGVKSRTEAVIEAQRRGMVTL